MIMRFVFSKMAIEEDAEDYEGQNYMVRKLM